jgi:pteridine reductase
MTSENRHIVVVGCARRIGLTLTQRFLECGYRVSGLYKTESSELSLIQKRFGDRFTAFPFDLRKPDQAAEMAQKAVRQNGSVFALIPVASQFYRTPLGQVTEASWDELFDTNVKGHFFLTQAFLSHLERPSHIINLIDIFSFKPLRGYIAYTAAKGALLSLTRNLANELAPYTQVNAISPGPVLLPENFTEEEKSLHCSRTLLGRTGSPTDIWNAVQFLLASRYITGMNLCVDGGSSLM